MDEKNNGIIEVNFKTRRKRNRKSEAIMKETFQRINGEIKDQDYLLPPGPECLGEEEITDHIRRSFSCKHPQMYEGYKKAAKHIFDSCKRCRSLFFQVSSRLAKKKISEI